MGGGVEGATLHNDSSEAEGEEEKLEGASPRFFSLSEPSENDTQKLTREGAFSSFLV